MTTAPTLAVSATATRVQVLAAAEFLTELLATANAEWENGGPGLDERGTAAWLDRWTDLVGCTGLRRLHRELDIFLLG